MDRLLMPPRSAWWKFSAGSSWLIWASLTVRALITLPTLPRGKVLKDDPKAIFTAASKAQQASDWMHAQQPQAEEMAA